MRDEDGINDENDSCPDEPGNSKNNGCPDNPAAIVDIINSSQILFNFSGDQPINQSDSFLNNLSELLKKYPYINLKIKGHASNEGPEQYNQVLSESRSANVKTILEFFKDKYVLIGASAQGLFDLVKIPLGVTVPGAEVVS